MTHLSRLPAAEPLTARVFEAQVRWYARLMPGFVGPWEIALLCVVVLLVFGPKRLPEMGRSLGRGMREFKHSISGRDEDDEPKTVELTASEEHVPVVSRQHDTIG